MPPATEHTHHLKIRNTQLEIPTAPAAGTRQGEDVEGKLRAAQVQLEQLQAQREDLERQRQEVEHLTERKREFISAQAELTQRFSSVLQRLEREIYDLKEHLADLEQCKACFSAHHTKLEKINPDGWARESLAASLDRAMSIADHADDEFSQAAEHYSRSRSAHVFNGSKTRRILSGEFGRQFRSGLAFNLPVILLGGVALLVYLFK